MSAYLSSMFDLLVTIFAEKGNWLILTSSCPRCVYCLPFNPFENWSFRKEKR